MLQTVQCRGYKAFSQLMQLELRPITVIFGKNNSGKTTLARLPLFVTHSLASENLYVLSAVGINFGSSFSDLASTDQAHPAVSIGATWSSGENLAIELQSVTSPEGAHAVQPISINLDGREVASFPLSSEPLSVSDWLVQNVDKETASRIQARRDDMAKLARSFLHVPGARPTIERTYEARDAAAMTAAEVPYLLAGDSSLLRATSQWISQNLGGIEIVLERAAFAFRLTGANGVNLSSSGRGTQSVLPVVALLMAVAGGHKPTELVVVEEPEEHLHPSAHGALADLVIAAGSRATVLVETHSENFILRLRRRLADRSLDLNQLGLYFVNDEHRVSEILLDRYGSAMNWPAGVFESDVEEAQAIVDSRLQAIDKMGESAC